MPQIDPKFTFWFGVWTNVLMLVAGYGIEHAPAIVAQYAPTVQWLAALSAQVNSVILTALVGVSSNKVGPLINAPIAAVKPLVILAAVFASLFAFPMDASAQTRRLAPPAITGDLKKDLNTDGQNLGLIPPSLVVQPTGNASADLQALWTKIVAASNVDLAYASKLAAGAGTQSSLIRKQCWDAITALNEQANGLNLKDAAGVALVKPDPHLFTDVETLAEVIDNLSPQGPLFTSCAGAAQLAKTNVLTFINSVVTGAAGIAAMPIIPGL